MKKKIPTEFFFAFSNFSAKFNKADSGPLDYLGVDAAVVFFKYFSLLFKFTPAKLTVIWEHCAPSKSPQNNKFEINKENKNIFKQVFIVKFCNNLTICDTSIIEVQIIFPARNTL